MVGKFGVDNRCLWGAKAYSTGVANAMEFRREVHVPQLHELAARGAYLGTSSWNYPGWIGQVYSGEKLFKKDGSLNKAAFEREQLKQLGETFPTACFDGQYYRFPVIDQLRKMADQVPHDFTFALKVTEDITVRRWEHTGRGKERGADNPSVLDVRLFEQEFLRPAIEGLGNKLGPIIFEFSPFKFSEFGGQPDYSPLQFVVQLHKFLEQLPKLEGLMLAVEVRDPEFLDPGFLRYRDCLEYHGVAHVLNEQTRMPEIQEQLELPGVDTGAPFFVIRALVRPGVKHNEAVDEFEPYDRTQIELPGMRKGIEETARRAIASNRRLYAYINNRTEGNAPNTIASVLELLFSE